MSDNFDPLDDYERHEGVVCPRCDGWKEIPCRCGGDLCVCENYGEKDCPLCLGDGYVTEEVYEKFVQREREIVSAFRAAATDKGGAE
jgi:hypothetical protein